VLEGGTDEVDFGAEKKNKLVNQVRALFGEEPVAAPSQAPPSPDLDEQTPHFLNPETLREQESQVDVAADEPGESETAEEPALASPEAQAASSQAADAVQMETVLNQGLAFLNTLSQMATGKAIVAETDTKTIEIDRKTGEVVLRFKLPGF
jgi:hypothetical protein